MEPKRWTEDEILSLDAENAYFERKSGDFLKDSKFEEKLAKQLSAFANTEGGLIVIGVTDEGDPDGVDTMHNDRLEKRQWLSQKVGSLLAPRLQAVHVDYAIPSEPSRIPKGKILLTIDVQKSLLAPHQTVNEYIYYYRVGSESLRAPHQYVESLFSRSRFPGPSVATAWIGTVINPLINQIELERCSNEKGDWGFEFTRPTGLRIMRNLLSWNISRNLEQFLIYQPDIIGLIESHDRALQELINSLNASHAILTDWWHKNFLELTSLDRLMALSQNDKNPEASRFRSCQNREDYLAQLFHDPDRKEMPKWFALAMVNPLNGDYNFMPFMRIHGEYFAEMRIDLFFHEIAAVRRAQKEFADTIDELATELRRVRIVLSERYGLPFEAS